MSCPTQLEELVDLAAQVNDKQSRLTLAFYMLKPYNHITGYLHRWTIATFGRWSVRIHKILSADATPFLHSHPFNYVSIVLAGEYSERVMCADGSLRVVRRTPGSIVYRDANVYHRIDSATNCTTLFVCRSIGTGGQHWDLRRHPEVDTPPEYNNVEDGLWAVEGGFRDRRGGMWFALRPTAGEAMECNRLSIYQNIVPLQQVTPPHTQ